MQSTIKLKYYDDLRNKLKKYPIVYLLGPRYVGKTVGVKLVSEELGQIDHISLHTSDGIRKATEVIEKISKEGEKVGAKAVVEGTAYRLAYTLYTKMREQLLDLKSYEKWLNVKDKKVEEVLKDERTVLAKMDEEDKEKLFEVLCTKVLDKEKLDKEKKEYLLSMASWKNYVVIPLLERALNEYGIKGFEDFKKVAEIEKKLVDYVEQFLLVKNDSFRSLFKKFGRDFVEIVAEIAEELLLGPLSILPKLMLFLVGLGHKSEDVIGRILYFREAWKRIPNEIRVLVCDEVDEAYGLPPGSCYEFLDSWFNVNNRAFIDELSRYVKEFAGKLNEFINKHEELRIELEKTHKEVEKLEKEMEELRKIVESLVKFTEIQSSLQGLYDAIYPDIRLDITWIRLGIDPVNGKIGQYTLVRSGMFEQYAKKVEEGLLNGKIVVVHGDRGIGKSVLARYVLSNLIRKNDRVWAITPRPSVPGENRPAKLVHSISSLGIDVILYYDPSGPEVYTGRGVPGAVDKNYIEAVLEVYKEISEKNKNSGTTHIKVSALLVIPEDFYEGVRKEIIQYKLEDKLFEVEPELSQDDFIRDVIKVYSGCSNIPNTLVEKVKNYSSYTLVAKLVGEWMKGKCVEAETEIEKALAESAGNAKAFIARYIWEAIFFNKNVELAEIEAIPLITRALWGPIPRNFFENPFIINYELEIEPVRISRAIREADLKDLFITWFSTRKEDLIEEVLKDIVLGNQELLEKVEVDLKDLVKAVENAKTNLAEFLSKRARKPEVEPEPKISKEDALLRELIIKSWTEYLPKVLGAELRKSRSIGCVRRFLYILGITTTSYAFSDLFKEFKENVGQILEVSERCNYIDDWLLVNREVPDYIRRLFLYSLYNFTTIIDEVLPNNIKEELCRDAEVMKNIITQSTSLRLSHIPYLTGLALTTIYHCREQLSDLLFLLNLSLNFFGPLPPGYSIFDFIPESLRSRRFFYKLEPPIKIEIEMTIKGIGEKLGWPEELAPIPRTLYKKRGIALCNINDMLFAKRNRMKPWAKAFLAEVYGMCSDSTALRYTDIARVYASRAHELLEEIQKDDEHLWYIAVLNTVPYLIGFYSELKDFRRVIDMLSQLELAASKLLKMGEKFLQSSEVREYLKWWFEASNISKDIDEMVYDFIIISYDLALTSFILSVSPKIMNTISTYIQVATNKLVNAPAAIREMIDRVSIFTKIKAIAGDLNAIKKELEAMWKEILDIWHTGIPYLNEVATRILAHYLVALALIGDDWRALLEGYEDLLRTSLNEPYRIAAQLMLNVLGGYEEKPSVEEVNHAINKLINELKKRTNLLIYHPITYFIEILQYLSEKNLQLAKERSKSLPELCKSKYDKELCEPINDLIPIFEELTEELEKCINGVLSDKARLILARLYYILF